MPTVGAVTFDFFRTLAHHAADDGGRGRALVGYLRSQGMSPTPWSHGLLHELMEPHAREYDPRAPATTREESCVRLARRVLERLGLTQHVSEADRHARPIWEIVGPSGFKLYDDVAPVLARLRAEGYRLAVISNFHYGLAHYCADLGIGDALDAVVASAEVGHAKPAREIFEIAAARLEIPPDRILHVGDSIVDDVEGASAAGYRTIWLDRSSTGAGRARPRVESLHDVLRLVGEVPGIRPVAGRGRGRCR